MTPREALATVLSDVSPPDPEWVASIADPPSVPSANWPGWADAVTAALGALGFTVAPVQDARDGEALRLLRVAVRPDGWISAGWMPGPNGWRYEMVASKDATPPPPAPRIATGPTLAHAADACRAALDGAR